MKTIIRKLIFSALLATTSLNFASNLYCIKNQKVVETKKNKGPKKAKKFFIKHASNPNDIREFLSNKSNRKNFTLIDNGKFIVNAVNSCIVKDNYDLLKVLFAVPVVREIVFKYSQKQIFKPLYIENDRVYYTRIPIEIPIGFPIGYYAASILKLAITNDDPAMVKDFLGFTEFRDALLSYEKSFLVRLIFQAAKNKQTKIAQLLVDDEKMGAIFFSEIKKCDTETVAKIILLFARNGIVTGVKELLSGQNVLRNIAAYNQGFFLTSILKDAAMFGHTLFIETLFNVKNFIDEAIATDKGFPIAQAIYIAVTNKHTDTVKYFMDNRELADIFATYDENCDLACDAVQKASEIGCLPIVELLLKNTTIAANFFTTDKQKQHFFDDAIKIATTNGHTAVVDYLKNHGNPPKSPVIPMIPVINEFSFDNSGPQVLASSLNSSNTLEALSKTLDESFVVDVKTSSKENQTQTKIPQKLAPVQISFAQKLKVLLKKVIESKYCKYSLITSVLILVTLASYSCINSLSHSLTQNTIIQNFAKCSSMAGCDSAAIACTLANLENECQAALDLINQE